MTEAEWLSSEDSAALLRHLTDGAQPSDRKLRLWVCACVRSQGPLEGKDAVDVPAIERLADAGASEHQYRALDGLLLGTGADWARRWAARKMTGGDPRAALFRDVFGNPSRPVELRHLGDALCRRCNGAGTRPDVYPPKPCPACSCITPVALSVARRAYECHDFAALPVLADALEEGGCLDEDLLGHLRGQVRCCACGKEALVWVDDAGTELVHCPVCRGTKAVSTGPHIRGCWALDLVLGKS